MFVSGNAGYADNETMLAFLTVLNRFWHFGKDTSEVLGLTCWEA